jgi:hypothetical protein
MSIEKREIDCEKCGPVTFTVRMIDHQSGEGPIGSTFADVISCGTCKIAAAAGHCPPVIAESADCPYLSKPY